MSSHPSLTQLQQENNNLAAQCEHLSAELAQSRCEYALLQQSEARYRQVFSNTPISMLFINTAGYITQMNPAAEEFYGLTLEKLNQQGCPIFENPQLVENGTLPYMLQAFAGEAVTELPTTYDSSRGLENGKLNYGQGYYSPIRNAAGEVEAIVEVIADMSVAFELQQQLYQEKQRAAQERNRLLTTVAEVANLLLRSSDYTIILPDVVRLLGEAVGSDRCSIFQNIVHHVLNKPAVQLIAEWKKYSCATTLKPMRSIFEAQGNTSMLVVPILVQGKCWGEIGFDNCGEPRIYDEAEIAILKIVADSIAAAIDRQAKEEELRRSEALYRSLFEISNEGIYRFEYDQPIPLSLPVEEQVNLVYEYCSCVQPNDAWKKMMGLIESEDVKGIRLKNIHIKNSDKNQNFVYACVENGHYIRNAESEEVDFNGKKRYFLNSVISFIENDCVTGGWSTQIDITELRETQQAFLQAEQNRVAELAKTNQALQNSLDRLAANPDLNSFLGYVLLEITQQLNLDTANLNLYDPITETLPLELMVKQGQVKLKHQIELPLPYLRPSTNSTPIWKILQETKRPFVINRDNGREYCFQDTYEYQASELKFEAVINLLLTLGSEPIGLLGLGSTQRTSFTPQELELAQALAHQATLAIQLTRLAEEAKQLAIIQERAFTAREIHDTLAQDFGGILMQLQAADRLYTLKPEKTQKHITRARDLARQGLAEARSSIWVLSQEGEAYSNLSEVLQQLVTQMAIGSDTQTTTKITGTPYNLNPTLGMNLLRIAQESLNNALRHANAKTITLSLDYAPTQLCLKINDDGIGFTLPSRGNGFGLRGMQQRADSIGAQFNLQSEPGQGTLVTVLLPIT